MFCFVLVRVVLYSRSMLLPSLLDIKYQDSTLRFGVSVCFPSTWPDRTSNFVKAHVKQRMDSAILSVKVVKCGRVENVSYPNGE
jgi:hypothetical protein